MSEDTSEKTARRAPNVKAKPEPAVEPAVADPEAEAAKEGAEEIRAAGGHVVYRVG